MFGATLYADIGTFITSPPLIITLKCAETDWIIDDLYVTVIYFDDYGGNFPLVV